MTVLLRGMAGLLLWATAFATLYALSGLGCALDWDRQPLAGLSTFRVMLLGGLAAFLIAHIALLAVISNPRFRAREPFWRQLESTVAIAGLVATLWSLSPAGLMTVECEQNAPQLRSTAAVSPAALE